MPLDTSHNQCHYCGSLSPSGPYCCSACEMLAKHTEALPILEKHQNTFFYLDNEDFKKLYKHPHGEFNYLFYAEGLHCSSCVHLLEKLPTFYTEIEDAQVNFGQSTVSVRLKDTGSLAQVAHVISELGYKPSLLGAADNLVERHKAENRSFLIRIAVAAFCAGNIMLFVIPVYSGLAGTYATVFNWLSFLLFLPILFYSAVPFYKGAWNSLKYKVVNVDLPISIAMLSGFIASTFNLLRGNENIYFDSTASFMFFILSARFLLKRVQQNYLSPSRLKSFFQAEKYTRLTGDKQEVLPWNAVKVGDRLLLQAQQNLPADCILESESAVIDMSLYNGESLPKTFSQGMELFAGTKSLDSNIEVTVSKSFENSKLGELFHQLDEGALKKSEFIALTDKLAQRLIVTVFAIAIIFFLVYMNIDVNEAFNRSLALIVLACPCALAFGSPLTFGLALKKANSMGILLKNSTSLEKILKIEKVFFDKTGTLTEGALTLSHSEPSVLSSELKMKVLSLESTSYHPIAFALRKAWKVDESLPYVINKNEILGSGVSGIIQGKKYEIRKMAESLHDEEIGIEVLEDGHSVCRLYFSDVLRAEAAQAIVGLKKMGIEPFLLSGDKKSRVFATAAACGIKKENTFGELFPEDKKAILTQYQNTCMIGDGANDSLSLQAADVGIAVKGSVDLSLNSADIYFTRGGLQPLFDLFKIAEKSRNVLVRNLTISLLYNAIGGLLSLMGLIDPLMAAILMPISSAIIIVSALWGFK